MPIQMNKTWGGDEIMTLISVRLYVCMLLCEAIDGWSEKRLSDYFTTVTDVLFVVSKSNEVIIFELTLYLVFTIKYDLFFYFYNIAFTF
jgi:hypothetical protein